MLEITETKEEVPRTKRIIVTGEHGALVVERARLSEGLIVAWCTTDEAVASFELSGPDAQRFADRIGAMMDGE